MKKTAAFTLIEMLVVLFIFSILAGSLFSILTGSDTLWNKGAGQLDEQRHGRRIMGELVRNIRTANPAYGITIASDPIGYGQNKIIYFSPNFNADGEFDGTKHWTYFKIGDAVNKTVIKRVQGCSTITLGRGVERIRFSGGACPGCNCNFSKAACLGCTVVNKSCPVVRVELRTKTTNRFMPATREPFTLVSFVTLRNLNGTSAAVEEEYPEEGEF
jgi:prepilin-type N-terminal cleavage/methylation domain-containing protein